MDRSDERKDTRTGDVLGLGSSAGTDTVEPPAHVSDEDRQRRRERMSEGVDDMRSRENESGDLPRGAGATGVDTGAGGEGTDVE